MSNKLKKNKELKPTSNICTLNLPDLMVKHVDLNLDVKVGRSRYKVTRSEKIRQAIRKYLEYLAPIKEYCKLNEGLRILTVALPRDILVDINFWTDLRMFPSRSELIRAAVIFDLVSSMWPDPEEPEESDHDKCVRLCKESNGDDVFK